MPIDVEVAAGTRMAFAILAVVMAGLVVWAMHRAERAAGNDRPRVRAAQWAAGLAVWLAATALAASQGVLRFEGVPPTMPLFMAVTLGTALVLAFSGVGRRLALGVPLGALVLAQGFRLPLELIMHRLAEDGLMPVQMSYAGLNFDIVTGLLAIPLGFFVLRGRAPLWLVRAWNVVGFVLLLNVLVIAMLSTPTPFRVFQGEPANVWITMAPWVWLPALLVPIALVGHIVVFRALRPASPGGP